MDGQKKRCCASGEVSALGVVAGLCLFFAAVEVNAEAWLSSLGPWLATSIGVGGVPALNSANDPTPPPCEPNETYDHPRLLPWFEFCTGMEPEAIELISICHSVTAWTDGAIVVTQTWGAWIYPRLAEEIPSLEIIPGARVQMFLNDRRLDDPAVWQDIAAYVSTVVTNPNDARFVLEVEWPLYPYWEGELQLDFERLAQGLSYLPPGVDYLWYPGGLAHWNQYWLAAQQQRCLNLWRTIQSAVPSVTFAAAGPSNTPYFCSRPEQIINDENLRAEGRQIMDSIYISATFDCELACLWPMSPGAAYEAISRVRTPEAYVWTMKEEWATLGRVMLSATAPPRVRRFEHPAVGHFGLAP